MEGLTISMHKAQFAVKSCEVHERKELHAYCKSCAKKICSSCIKEDHSSHDWELIVDILKERRRNLPTECKGIRSKQILDLRKEIDRFERSIETTDAEFERNKSVLNQSRTCYINDINRLFDERIEEYQRRSESAKQALREHRDNLTKKVQYLEMMTSALDVEIDTLPDHDILDMEREMRDELEKALAYSTDQYTCTTVFIGGERNAKVLNDMIGYVHSISLEKMNEFNRYPSNIVVYVKAVATEKAYVQLDKDYHAKLINCNGEELGVMKQESHDLIITNDGDKVLTSWKGKFILVLDGDDLEKANINTTPLRPSYISKTENDEILVTLMDSSRSDSYNLEPSSRRIVQRMTLAGKVLRTYEFREDGKTRLFTWPTTKSENKNSDVCVVNHIKENTGELVVLYKDGPVKFIYRGKKSLSEHFNPIDVCCDAKGHILLTEEHSKSIQVLNSEGTFVCTLCQYKDVNPFLISLYGDALWCSIFDGKLKVFRYCM
ncbi:hypothetical protein FSP39_015623 [Pinctada imbricata]|uniref:B box-type domain-containing protein n=1 Tax=Pinctada imbricata TaxID=66713 RepID=A0AA88YCY8_PINIB|nr:hypothetical protein FSP39_015623 [Pinctada imbricata]